MYSYLYFVLVLFFAIPQANAAQINRQLVASLDAPIQLDTFIYTPDFAAPKGVVLAVGGSGFTRAGFGGPSTLAKYASSLGYIAIEWNKRGLTTNSAVNDVQKDLSVYRTATFDRILVDAESILAFSKRTFPGMPIYIVGGSEGSAVTSRLAEFHPTEIRAIATFGTLVSPFVEIISKQLSDQIVAPNWKNLDANGDQVISEKEFEKIKGKDGWDFLTPFAFKELDVTGDNAISYNELERFIVNYFVNEHPDQDFWLNSSGVATGWIESMFRIPSLFERAKNIRIPYIVLHGESDDKAPIKYVYEFESFTKHLKYENFRFKYHAGVGHGPNEKMFSEILEFFRMNE